MRCLFDKLLNKYPMLVCHLANIEFEVANGAKTKLDKGERHQIRRFLKPIEDDDEVVNKTTGNNHRE